MKTIEDILNYRPGPTHKLYLPREDGEHVANKMIGLAHLSSDLFYKINGIGPYVGKRMRTCSLVYTEYLSTSPILPGDPIPDIVQMQVIICEAEERWYNCRNLYDACLIVISQEDQELVRRLGGENGIWMGW